jgi:endonuclease III
MLVVVMIRSCFVKILQTWYRYHRYQHNRNQPMLVLRSCCSLRSRRLWLQPRFYCYPSLWLCCFLPWTIGMPVRTRAFQAAAATMMSNSSRRRIIPATPATTRGVDGVASIGHPTIATTGSSSGIKPTALFSSLSSTNDDDDDKEDVADGRRAMATTTASADTHPPPKVETKKRKKNKTATAAAVAVDTPSPAAAAPTAVPATIISSTTSPSDYSPSYDSSDYGEGNPIGATTAAAAVLPETPPSNKKTSRIRTTTAVVVTPSPAVSSSSPTTTTTSSSDDSSPQQPVNINEKKVKKKRRGNPVDSTHSPPDDWRNIWSLVEELRRDQTAPCDVSGCEALPDGTLSPAIFRFQVLLSLMLSSQTKDAVVGAAVRAMQRDEVATVAALSVMAPTRLNPYINKCSFHNNKTKYILETVLILRDSYGSDIPTTADELMTLPGVGPKMAYICESVAWGTQSGIGVDTHMHRLFNQLGFVATKTPEQTRVQLQSWLPREYWAVVNGLWVGFGQEVQQEKAKLLRKALYQCSRPQEALRLFQRCGFTYYNIKAQLAPADMARAEVIWNSIVEHKEQ